MPPSRLSFQVTKKLFLNRVISIALLVRTSGRKFAGGLKLRFCPKAFESRNSPSSVERDIRCKGIGRFYFVKVNILYYTKSITLGKGKYIVQSLLPYLHELPGLGHRQWPGRKLLVGCL